MNIDNLHALIEQYEKHFYILNSAEHDEIFKWRAAGQFRDVWFSKDAAQMTFSEKFNAAKKEFSILTDNSYVSPANGIVKIAEKDGEAVERLFTEILFSDDGGDLTVRQNNMDLFLEKIDELRAKHYPQSFKFKQDRHAVSCYLAFYAPDRNYIYRFSDAEAFAQHIEFGKDIGAGRDFRLDYYYEMCDIIVEALKKHPTLLDKHFNFLSDKCYRDESLHILAFDLMYCCRTYNYYEGMTHKSKKESIRSHTEAKAREKERIERDARIAQIKAALYALELQAEPYKSISLLNVEVFHAASGKGTVISQEMNKITVQFATCQKVFIISKKFPLRPTFENDAETVEAFTAYEELCQEIKRLKNKLQRIQEAP